MTEANANQYKIKNYWALAAVGHVGTGYFVPVLFPVKATSLEEAKQIAREIPRVKHDQQHAIIMCKACTYEERKLAKYINDFDEFLTSDIQKSSSEEVQARRIRTRLYIEELEKDIQKRNDENLMAEYTTIKTADKYPKNMVLQRYCAPINAGGRLIFKHINSHDMLKEYFETKTAEILGKPLTPPDPQALDYDEQFARYAKLVHSRDGILKNYYSLYGPNNDLGVTYDAQNHTLSHHDLQEPVKFTHDDKVKPIFATSVVAEEESFDGAAPASRPSQIDKFNARLAKTAELKK